MPFLSTVEMFETMLLYPLMGFNVGFNVHARVMAGNIEFDKVESIEKVLHDIQHCGLWMSASPLISLIYFVQNYLREAHLTGISITQPDI